MQMTFIQRYYFQCCWKFPDLIEVYQDNERSLSVLENRMEAILSPNPIMKQRTLSSTVTALVDKAKNYHHVHNSNCQHIHIVQEGE
jgi:hypothetical protein